MLSQGSHLVPLPATVLLQRAQPARCKIGPAGYRQPTERERLLADRRLGKSAKLIGQHPGGRPAPGAGHPGLAIRPVSAKVRVNL